MGNKCFWENLVKTTQICPVIPKAWSNWSELTLPSEIVGKVSGTVALNTNKPFNDNLSFVFLNSTDATNTHVIRIPYKANPVSDATIVNAVDSQLYLGGINDSEQWAIKSVRGFDLYVIDKFGATFIHDGDTDSWDTSTYDLDIDGQGNWHLGFISQVSPSFNDDIAYFKKGYGVYSVVAANEDRASGVYISSEGHTYLAGRAFAGDALLWTGANYVQPATQQATPPWQSTTNTGFFEDSTSIYVFDVLPKIFETTDNGVSWVELNNINYTSGKHFGTDGNGNIFKLQTDGTLVIYDKSSGATLSTFAFSTHVPDALSFNLAGNGVAYRIDNAANKVYASYYE